MDVSFVNETQEERILKTLGTDDTMQPKIGEEEEEEYIEEDVVDDKEKKLMEDEIRRLQKGDAVETISTLRVKSDELFRLQIPLCKLVAMPMIRPTLSYDIKKLEQEFAGGYRDGASVFYVSTTNEVERVHSSQSRR